MSGRRAAPATDARLLLPALCAWSAVATTLSLSAGNVLALAGSAALAGVALLTWWLRGDRARPVRAAWLGVGALTLLCTALCLLATAGHQLTRSAGIVPELARERATAHVEGEVVSDPMVISDAGSNFTEHAASGRRELVVVRLVLRTVVGRGERSEPRTPVLVFGDSSWTTVHWHERVRAVGRLEQALPGDDVVAVLNPRGPPVSVAPAGPVARAAEHVRAGLRDAVDDLPPDARGLLPGLVIGDTSRTPQSLTDAMRSTGMTHLSAVSGSNVAVILTAAMLLCRALFVPRRWRPVVAVVCLAGFVVLARPEPSVLRAAVMGSVGLLGLSTSRRRAGLPALSAAVLVLLCIDPWLARSFGFALSTLATLGLLLFARTWGAWFARFLPQRIKGWGDAIAIPVAAQAMCGPVVVLLQGSVTVVGVLANVLAAPLVAPATVLGVAVSLLALLPGPLATGLAWVAALPTIGIAWIARACAAVPMGQLPWPDGGPGAVLLGAATIGLLFTAPWLAVRVRRYPLPTACLVVLALASAWPTGGFTWPPPGWRFVACDVGEGDGTVLATAGGHAVVVDTGTDPAVMDACLHRLHVGVVDAVVLTHFHADHAGGLPGVLHGRRVGVVYVTPVDDPAEMARSVRRWAAEAGVPVRELYAGASLSWGDVTARVLWPAYPIHEGSIPNNASIVLDVDARGLRLLLTGDIEREAAQAVRRSLTADPAFAGVDVLKVAHHGSSNQDPALVAMTHASVAVISVGAANDYGHPAPSLLTMLHQDAMTVVRTDRGGDVAVLGTRGHPRVATRR